MRILSSKSAQDKLKKHIAKLKHELEDLKSGQHSSSSLADTIEEFGDRLRQHGRNASHHLADQAHMVHTKAKQNPAATFVIAAGIGFLAAMLMRRD